MKKQHVILVAFAVQVASAQFTLDGEFRPRSEYFGNGGNFTRTDAGGNKLFPAGTAMNGDEGFVRTSVRAALNAMYKADTYTVYTSFQEVFVMGDRYQTQTTGNGNLRVQEAWANIKLCDSSNFTLKVGRQELSYDDQRILGGLGWAQQARTHDAAVFMYEKDGYNLHVGGALNTIDDEIYNTSQLFSYRDMGFIRANKKYDDFNISVLGLVNTFQDNANPDKSSLITTGLHMDYKLDDLSLTSNLFMQEGERVGGADVKGAFLASLGADYKINDKNSLGLSYEVISGRNSESAAFFPLYGTNHAFNGLIDRFYVGNHANAGGLNDLNLTYKTKISGVAVTITGHYFTEHSDVVIGSDDLGSEIDIVLAKKFKEFTLVGGYSHFFEPSYVADLSTTKDTQNWAWAMLVIKPKFINGAVK